MRTITTSPVDLVRGRTPGARQTGSRAELGSTGKIPWCRGSSSAALPPTRPVSEAVVRRDDEAPPEVRKWMLEEVVAALRPRANLAMPKSWAAAFEALMKSDDPAVVQQAEFVAVKFGDKRVLPGLRKTLADRAQGLERRRWALESLLAGKDGELAPVLFGLLDESALRLAALNAVASTEHAETAAKALANYGKYSKERRTRQLQR
jgi:hypothetical protein